MHYWLAVKGERSHHHSATGASGCCCCSSQSTTTSETFSHSPKLIRRRLKQQVVYYFSSSYRKNLNDLNGITIQVKYNAIRVCLLLALFWLLSVAPAAHSLAVGAAQPVQFQPQQQITRLVSLKPGKSRLGRQIAATTSWQSQANVAQQQDQQRNQQQSVPYKTFYVTRACEWKSNLFVPKSNDIHFAQTQSSSLGGSLLPSAPNDESLVVYETLNSNYASASRQQQVQHQQQQQQQQQQQDSRTMLTTDSKALILALPIASSPSFAGFEEACSIRLIVPRNMRILAELSSRGLTFAQEQLVATDWEAPDQQLVQSLWLNVSQSQFTETIEHKTFETEGNVLAFRFLLKRFASRKSSETRFQVVLTAFQTLGENSDINGGNLAINQQSSTTLTAPLHPNAQFICDQQRLISADLACDGFKNCQDGHDEEPATCSSFRSHSTNLAPSQQPPTRDQISPGEEATVTPSSGNDTNWFWFPWNRSESNSLAGFLFGFLLVLLLLTCCTCCSYLGLLFWRHRSRLFVSGNNNSNRRQAEQVADERESDALAEQNILNAARQKEQSMMMMIEDDNRLQQQQRQHQLRQPFRSILKKPATPTDGRPAEAPPAVPIRPMRLLSSVAPIRIAEGQEPSPRRGALADSLSRGGSGRKLGEFRPTPAQRLTRPTVSGQDEQRGVSAVGGATTRTNASATPTTTTNAMSTGTTTQRITTYHYSSGTTRISESYLQRLAERPPQPPVGGGLHTSRASATPPGEQNVNYATGRQVKSPRSSLI